MPVLLFPIFHPAAALRTDSVKQLLREDIAKLPALLAEEVGRRPGGAEPDDRDEAEQIELFK
jgi:hypothetical protein